MACPRPVTTSRRNRFPSPRGVIGSLAPVIPVRDDLRVLEGYHSPQVDVKVRLNTNESPLPPPAAWGDAFAAELSRVEWHRYPDRQATELRQAIADLHHVSAEHGLRRQRLERGAADDPAHVRRPRPQRRHVRADVSDARPDRSCHRLDGDRGRAQRRLHARPGRDAAGRSPPATRTSYSSLANNPTGLVEPADRIADMLSIAPGLVVADEAYAQFADWSALDLVDESTAIGGDAHVLQDVEHGGVRLGYAIGPTWFVRELEKVTLPYHLDTAKQIAGRLALRFVDEMDARVRLIVGERQRISEAMRAMRDRRHAQRRQLRAVPSARRRRSRRSGSGCSTATCSCATARGGRGLRVACGSRSARRTRMTPFSPLWPSRWEHDHEQVRHPQPRPPRRRRSRSRSTSTAPA